MKPRSWRWWHWLAVSLLLFVLSFIVAVISLHSWSTARLETVEAQLRAEGRPTRYVEHLATAPTYDSAQRQAWLALEARWQKAGDGNALQPVTRWLDGGAPAPTPPEVSAWLTTHGGLLYDTTVVLRHVGPTIGTWPDPALFAAGRHPSMSELSAATRSNLSALRACAYALATAALTRQDDDKLGDLDHLVASIAPNSLLDGMFLRVIVTIRERAHLLALLRGADGPATATWMTSTPVMLALGRRAVLGERLYVSAWFADIAISANFVDGLYWWTLGAADTAVVVESMARIESRLNGIAAPSLAIPGWAFMSHITVPLTAESSQSLIEGEAQERAARIAAELVRTWRAGEQPPTDQACAA